MNKVGFGKRLKAARNEKHLTGEALAELCNINASYLRQMECGMKIPSLTTFVLMCNALGVSPHFLLADSLENQSEDDFTALMRQMTPEQAAVVKPMIQSVLEHISGGE